MFIGHIPTLYEVPLINGNKNINGDPQYYSEIKSGTGVSFYKQDLGALNEAGMHYEFGDGCEYDVIVGGPGEPAAQYEKPGVIFTTDTAGTEFKKAVSCAYNFYLSCKTNQLHLASAN